MRRFVTVGVVALILDFAAYQACLAVFPELVSASKAVGFLLGVATSFALNYRWTFGGRGVSVRQALPRFLILQAITLTINVGVNSLTLSGLPPGQASIVVAFLVATSISAVVSFLGMRTFVFRGPVLASE